MSAGAVCNVKRMVGAPFVLVVVGVTTDLDLTEITYLARNMGKMYFTSDTIVRLPGETVMGERYAEFYPDESWLHDFVVEKFCVPAE